MLTGTLPVQGPTADEVRCLRDDEIFLLAGGPSPETLEGAAALLARWTLMPQEPKLQGQLARIGVTCESIFLEWCLARVGPDALERLWYEDVVLAARFIDQFSTLVSTKVQHYQSIRVGGIGGAMAAALARRWEWLGRRGLGEQAPE